MSRRPETIIREARERIARIRDALSAIDYLCSGTLLQRTKVCGKPGCRCAQDPSARHGPYYEWGHMKGGRLVHRTVSPEQATILPKGDVLKRTKKENLGRRSNWRSGNPSEKHHSDNRAE